MQWKFIVRIYIFAVSFLILFVSIVWVIDDPSFEPFLTVLGAFTAILYSVFLENKESQKIEPKNFFFPSIEPDFRQRLIRRVRSEWIDGVLKPSVEHPLLLDFIKATYKVGLGMKPADLVFLPHGNNQEVIKSDKPLIDLFNESHQALLILGAPGSGKTVTSLQLVEQLLTKASNKEDAKVPIVFKLATWTNSEQSLTKWIVRQAFRDYQLSQWYTREILIFKRKIILCLDGLDEVASINRDSCVAAINEFQKEFMIPMIISCRQKEYDLLQENLNLADAIFIQPLSQKSISNYLSQFEEQLSGLREVLQESKALRQLSRVPLFLTLMPIAYENSTVSEIIDFDEENLREQLIRRFISKVFVLRPLYFNEYDEVQALDWLINIAFNLYKTGQQSFFIELIDFRWIHEKGAQRLSKGISLFSIFLVSPMIHYVVVCLGILMRILLFRVEINTTYFELVNLVFLTSFALPLQIACSIALFWIIDPSDEGSNLVYLNKPIKWSDRLKFLINKYYLIYGIIFGVMGTLISSFILYFFDEESREFSFNAVFFIFILFSTLFILGFGLINLIVSELGGRLSNKEESNRDSRVANNRVVLTLLSALDKAFLGFIASFFVTIFMSLTFTSFAIISSSITLCAFMFFGVTTFTNHYSIRLILTLNNSLPFGYLWNDFQDKSGKLSNYLDEMETRILLKRVGGGWIFIMITSCSI